MFTFLLTVSIMFLNLLSFGKLSDDCSSRLDPSGSLELSGKHGTAVWLSWLFCVLVFATSRSHWLCTIESGDL